MRRNLRLENLQAMPVEGASVRACEKGGDRSSRNLSSQRVAQQISTLSTFVNLGGDHHEQTTYQRDGSHHDAVACAGCVRRPSRNHGCPTADLTPGPEGVRAEDPL